MVCAGSWAIRRKGKTRDLRSTLALLQPHTATAPNKQQTTTTFSLSVSPPRGKQEREEKRAPKIAEGELQKMELCSYTVEFLISLLVVAVVAIVVTFDCWVVFINKV